MYTPPAGAPQQKPSGWQRFLGALMPTPRGAGALLTPDDLRAARSQGLLGIGTSLLRNSRGGPGLLASLGEAIPAGQEQFSQAAQGAAQGALGERELNQQMQRETQRQAILARYGNARPGETPEQLSQRLTQMFAAFASVGDLEMTARLAQVVPSLQRGATEKEPGTWVSVPGPDGKPMRRYVTAGEAGAGIPEYERPQRDTNRELTLYSQLNGALRLQDNYAKAVEGVQTTVDSFISGTNAAKVGGAGDLQILYSFIRALDPNSVVREGEVALARQAASLYSQAHILKQKLETEGGALSPIMRQQMLGLMKDMVELKVERAEHAYNNTNRMAKQFGLEIDLLNPVDKYKRFLKSQEQQTPAAPGQAVKDLFGGIR